MARIPVLSLKEKNREIANLLDLDPSRGGRKQKIAAEIEDQAALKEEKSGQQKSFFENGRFIRPHRPPGQDLFRLAEPAGKSWRSGGKPDQLSVE